MNTNQRLRSQTATNSAVEPMTVNQKEAAELLGVSSRTVYNLRKRGEIEPLPQFTRPRYSVEALKAAFGKQDDAA